MTILVSDANIFIDMEVAKLTRSMFRLEDTFATPDLIYHEELSEHHPELPGLGLRVEKLNSEAIADVERMTVIYTQTSTNDLFALALAKERQWPLLSGDWRLREAAMTERVEIYGTLWLVERMVIGRTISLEQAGVGFELMKYAGRRLPWAQVEALLKRLSQPNGRSGTKKEAN